MQEVIETPHGRIVIRITEEGVKIFPQFDINKVEVIDTDGHHVFN